MPKKYIEAEELKHILNNSKYYGTKAGNAFADMITECKAVEERKKGFWEWVDDMDYRCSVCHKYAYGCIGEVLSGDYKYCPYCGAAMEGEEDDEDN